MCAITPSQVLLQAGTENTGLNRRQEGALSYQLPPCLLGPCRMARDSEGEEGQNPPPQGGAVASKARKGETHTHTLRSKEGVKGMSL